MKFLIMKRNKMFFKAVESLCQQMATVTTEDVGGWRRLFRKHAPEMTAVGN